MLKIRDANGEVKEILAIILTEEDKKNIANKVIANLPAETWTFTLEDGSTVTKTVVLKV